ncbi:MAG TPA: delta-60 repeat domain-containing protein, partial [Actinomycetota bacterium]
MFRRAMLPLISALALILSAVPAATSAPGDLDPTFGGEGIVRTDLTRFEDHGFAVALQPDGKIVVAGTKGLGGPNARVAVVRYAVDGSLDPSFGG